MKNRKTALIQVKPGEKVRLPKIAADNTGDYKGKEESFERLAALQARLGELQERLYAEDKRSLLLVFQAMDTGGKDGAVKSLLTGINPVGVQVTSFKAPSQEELDHDYLWRVHQKVPGHGLIGVWNRSHYEDVLIVRVHKLIDEETVQARFEQINNFEKMLVENGTTIVKFFLHISKDEQKERLQARLDNPEKHWKFNLGDLKERALWDDYRQAYEDVLNHCSTAHAPWYLVPADKKWARNIAVAEAVVAALEKMNPQFPKVDINPSAIVIE
jgi:PPK2 family polyphosphate:nucleotide phosphotransferase